jgi:hypothetical protein
MVWYGTVRLVRFTEEEKYGTDIWVVLLLPILYNTKFEFPYRATYISLS